VSVTAPAGIRHEPRPAPPPRPRYPGRAAQGKVGL